MIHSYYPSNPHQSAPEGEKIVFLGIKTRQSATGTMYEHFYSDSIKEDLVTNDFDLKKLGEVSWEIIPTINLDGVDYKVIPKENMGSSHLKMQLISIAIGKDRKFKLINMPADEFKQRLIQHIDTNLSHLI